VSEGRPGNEDAPRVPGEEGGGAPWGKILAAAAVLILLAILIPLACQALGGGSGGGQGAGEEGSPGAERTSGEGNGPSGANGGDAGEGATVAPGSEETTGGEGTASGGSAVAAADISGVGYQSSADGESVTVPRATLSGAEGWLAVRADEGGEPGEVLGYTRLEEGENTEVEVEFDRPVESSQMLYAVVHVEDPADGDFTFPDGDPPVERDGEMALEPIQYAVAGDSEAADEDAAAGTAPDEDEVDGSEPPESLADTSGPSSLLLIGTALLLTGGLLRLFLRDEKQG
jgi:hypothetical protein